VFFFGAVKASGNHVSVDSSTYPLKLSPDNLSRGPAFSSAVSYRGWMWSVACSHLGENFSLLHTLFCILSDDQSFKTQSSSAFPNSLASVFAFWLLARSFQTSCLNTLPCLVFPSKSLILPVWILSHRHFS
jgi:hypothetical protein